MSRHLIHYVTSTVSRSTRSRFAAVASVAAAGAALAFVPLQHSSAGVAPASSQTRAFATCDGIGKLTMTGGKLRTAEHILVDRRGRSHVFFTVVTHRVTAADADGRTYQFRGSGYDYVVYAGRDLAGRILHEDEVFAFSVTSKDRVAGVVQYHLHSGPDGAEHRHNASTCVVDGMS